MCVTCTGMGKLLTAQTTIFTRSDQKFTVVVGDGQRIVIMARGDKPELAPIEEAGEYVVDCHDFAQDGTAQFPVVLSVVDLAHIPAWLNLSQEATERILDRCEAAAKASGQ